MKSRITAASTVLLTGASAGLGRHMARVLGATGCSLLLVARRREALEDLAAEIGPQAVPVPLDLSEPAVADRLLAALGDAGVDPHRVDVLINNAGVGSFGPFVETDPGRLAVMQRINLRVPMELARTFAPMMVERGSGTIANVASVAAFSPGPLMTEYYADKAWLLSFGVSLDAELRPHGVHVVTVCPGPFASDFHGASGMHVAGMGRMPAATAVARGAVRAIARGRLVAPLGAGARVWRVLGPRLPLRLSRRIMHALQRRRLPPSS